ncbi:uncharacterized protein BX664DRAFT_291930 [Halteromyces radiatus]|uniref:uncharacterized protein n=1 Tax=Halteromyces radiatus TaxID=101107 RepID=UPI00221F9D05|nr:uncharacterized protein BX664DRAFT_291930 [Halteromyces radiatus]KAI8096792.1 hypothetical protein BX664DRAFT_291930 [Halteromyces radiatus]
MPNSIITVTNDENVNDDSQIYFKPDTIDTPVYEKPNAYEEEEQVDALVVGLNSTQLDKVNEYEDDGEEPIHTTVVRYKTRKSKMAPPPPATSPLLSHGAMTATTSTTIIPEDEFVKRPLSTSSFDSQAISPSVSSTSTTDSIQSSTSCKQMLLDSLKRRPSSDVVKFDLRKQSLVQPHHHDIYLGGTKQLVYRKRQPHSYSWGFQNILYLVTDDDNFNKKTKYGIKVAEARRRAFQKQITVEWGLNEDDDKQQRQDDERQGTRSNQLINSNNTRLLFIYTTYFESDFCIRWRRPSLVSHDMICEIRLKKKWQLLAEFDSHGMGYLIHLGQLMIDRRGLSLVNNPDHLECHLLITCCTLVDLMREVVQKAMGLSNGGVANG